MTTAHETLTKIAGARQRFLDELRSAVMNHSCYKDEAIQLIKEFGWVEDRLDGSLEDAVTVIYVHSDECDDDDLLPWKAYIKPERGSDVVKLTPMKLEW